MLRRERERKKKGERERGKSRIQIGLRPPSFLLLSLPPNAELTWLWDEEGNPLEMISVVPKANVGFFSFVEGGREGNVA